MSVASSVFLLILITALAVPVVMGIYVWRDASRRGMNAVLWVLLTVLAPAFIGLIIYLIVRGEQGSACPTCGKPVRDSFTNCPWCGTRLREQVVCQSCGTALEAGWANCPSCGTAVPDTLREMNLPKKDKGLGVLLGVLIVVPIVLVVLMVIAGLLFSTVHNIGSWSTLATEEYTEMEKELTPEAQELVESLRGKPDIYMLHERFNTTEGVCDIFLLYRNDGVYSVATEPDAGGWIRKPRVLFRCTQLRVSGETFLQFEGTSRKGQTPVILDQYGTELSYTLIEMEEGTHMLSDSVNYAWDVNNIAAAEVFFENCPSGIYGISLHCTDENGETITSNFTCNADGSEFGNEGSVRLECSVTEGDRISVCVYGANEMLVYETEPLEVKPGAYVAYGFTVAGSPELQLISAD